MRKRLRRACLHLSKAVGLFALARRLSRGGLRILGYHGGSFQDEHVFRPWLFISPEVFRRRLQLLARGRYPVLDLGTALEALGRNALPPCATVITIDDGFYSTYRQALDALEEFSFPATVYVTSYHAARGTPVFRLVLQYMIWKTRFTEVDCTGLGLGQSGMQPLQTLAQREKLFLEMIRYGEAHLTDAERSDRARELGRRLQVDYDRIAAGRWFHIMTTEEIRLAAARGFDIQLHTHRHRCPLDEELVRREVEENRDFLRGLTDGPLVHFCYPSGEWDRKHWDWLEAAGVESATTCDRGLNYPGTPRFALKRFLDADTMSDIEFEAELSGFGELLRRGSTFLRRLPGQVYLFTLPSYAASAKR